MGVGDTISAVVGGVKKVREIAQKMHDADLQNAIADLYVSAADLKMEVADAREENVSLRAQIKELTERLDIRQKLERRGNFYYLKNPSPGYSEGPYCLTCFDEDAKLIGVPVFDGHGSQCRRCFGLKR